MWLDFEQLELTNIPETLTLVYYSIQNHYLYCLVNFQSFKTLIYLVFNTIRNTDKRDKNYYCKENNTFLFFCLLSRDTWLWLMKTGCSNNCMLCWNDWLKERGAFATISILQSNMEKKCTQRVFNDLNARKEEKLYDACLKYEHE